MYKYVFETSANFRYVARDKCLYYTYLGYLIFLQLKPTLKTKKKYGNSFKDKGSRTVRWKNRRRITLI